MDIRQLEGFLWISRLGSVTAACKRLNVTQSAISMRLRALEDELQVELFDRSHKKLTLTAKGQDLIKYAEDIVRTVEQIRLKVASPSMDLGRLRIGMSELVGLTWGPALAQMIIERHPNISVDLETGVPAALMEGLMAKKLDLLIGPASTAHLDSITAKHLGSVEFGWVGRRQIDPKALSEETIIAYDNDQSLLFPAIRRTLGESELRKMRFIGCNSIATTLQMVLKGSGISLLPKVLCQSHLDSGDLQIVLDKAQRYDYYAVCRTKDLSGLPGLVVAVAEEMFAREITS